MKNNLLVADDEYGIREFMFELFKDEYNIFLAENGEQAIQLLTSETIDVALLDMRMPNKSGLDVLDFINTQKLQTVSIIITADRDITHAVDAMKMGAFDYVTKPVDYKKLDIIVRNAAEKKLLKEQVLNLRKEIKTNFSFPNIIGNSKPMKTVFYQMENVLNNDATVLLYGKSGTGKEIIAKAIHYNGNRFDRPFIPVDCASIPSSLIETELFGYEKGAFTGADKTTKGKFEIAHRGTLFLDEISNISMEAQAKLLRVLQEKEFSRIGGEKKIKVDVRIISASNKNLKEMINSGSFREDLFYRLNVIPINVPELKQRKEDIPLLISKFLNRYNKQYQKKASVNEQALKALIEYSWPGNVRELENLLNRLVLTADSDTIKINDLPEEIAYKSSASNTSAEIFSEDFSLEKIEKTYIEKVLKRHEHNISTVAKILNITRKTLYSKIEKYGIKKEP